MVKKVTCTDRKANIIWKIMATGKHYNLSDFPCLLITTEQKMEIDIIIIAMKEYTGLVPAKTDHVTKFIMCCTTLKHPILSMPVSKELS